VQGQQIRVHALPDGNEMGHVGHADLATQQAHDMKERRNVSAAWGLASPPVKIACSTMVDTRPMKAKDAQLP